MRSPGSGPASPVVTTEGGPSVLVVEDDESIATQLVRGLTRGGYLVDHVGTGSAALARNDADVVLLDLELPDADGVQVCRKLHERSDSAIIVITAHGEEPDRVMALDAGADDYLVKPFGLAELQARIRAVLRRVRPESELVRHGPLVIDMRTRRVTVGGHEIPPRLPRLLRRQHSRPDPGLAAAPGGSARYLAVGSALAVGVLVAALAMHLSDAWNGGFGFH
jgi:DNA-binding response OmpR family regulator